MSSTVRELFPEWSPRTQARMARAMRLNAKLRDNFGIDCWEEANRAATRPNGSLNVETLLRYVEYRTAMLTASLPREPGV